MNTKKALEKQPILSLRKKRIRMEEGEVMEMEELVELCPKCGERMYTDDGYATVYRCPNKKCQYMMWIK
jgi:acetyl-CoA carboxylase beta subunit